jgi:hypothetical protein
MAARSSSCATGTWKQHFEQFDVFGSPIDAPKSPFHQKQWARPGWSAEEGPDLRISLPRAPRRGGQQLRDHRSKGGGRPEGRGVSGRGGQRTVRPGDVERAGPSGSELQRGPPSARARALLGPYERERRALRRHRGAQPRCRAAAEGLGRRGGGERLVPVGLVQRSAAPGRARRSVDLRAGSALRRPLSGRDAGRAGGHHSGGRRVRPPAQHAPAAHEPRPPGRRHADPGRRRHTSEGRIATT